MGTSTHRTQCNRRNFLLCPRFSEDPCSNNRTHTTALPGTLTFYSTDPVAGLCECSGAEPWGFSNLLINVLWPQDPFSLSGSRSPTSAKNFSWAHAGLTAWSWPALTLRPRTPSDSSLNPAGAGIQLEMAVLRYHSDECGVAMRSWILSENFSIFG